MIALFQILKFHNVLLCNFKLGLRNDNILEFCIVKQIDLQLKEGEIEVCLIMSISSSYLCIKMSKISLWMLDWALTTHF